MMVFRQLRSPADFVRARSLIGTEVSGDEILSGLWDLAAADSDVLVAIVATRRVSPSVVEVKAMRGYAGQARLLREVADDCRAQGVERLVAAGCVDADVLRRAGFVPDPGTGRLVLQL
ncbi:hypothetical protein [Paractinoplanes rishiriensis]|nr:hypothetical protein [Actinoplanes rishiriensis]